MFDAECFTDIINLYYNGRENWYEDEDGEAIICVYEIITPDDEYIFHQKMKDLIVPHRYLKQVGVKLIYPSEGACWYCANYDECYSDEYDYMED